MLPEKVKEHISTLEEMVDRLLSQTPIPYSKATPASFPEGKGIYVITASQNKVMRAGKTDRSIRDRLYRNHLMGDQAGNLRAQLVASGRCPDFKRAKEWIRENCSARFLEIDDRPNRANVEHFMLAVLQPEFCDDNKSLGEN